MTQAEGAACAVVWRWAGREVWAFPVAEEQSIGAERTLEAKDQ